MFYDIYAVRNYGFLFYGVMIATIMATGNALLFLLVFWVPLDRISVQKVSV